MSSTLDELLEYERRTEESLKTYDKMIKNQRRKERKIIRGVKTGLVSAIIVSSLFGGYAGYKYIDARWTSKYEENKRKLVYYQDKFDEVKNRVNKNWYTLGDKLSEELQQEMKEEDWFSPSRELYKEVKEYDDRVVDPVMKKIKRRNWEREHKNKWYYTPLKHAKDLWDSVFE